MAIADITPAAPPEVALPTVPAAPVAQAVSSTGPTQRRFDVDEYYKMAEAGILSQLERVELIDGVIIEMNPIGNRHAECVDRLTELLVLAFTKKATTRIQGPVRLGRQSEPQPDCLIFKLRQKGAEAHPGPDEVLLAIEVSDTSLAYDRGLKAQLYAAAGILEYWLVDLHAETIEVRRKPNGAAYEELHTLRRGEPLHCLAFPEAAFEVAAILG
ncbi:MAG: Uma2 family endonuclease [Planctomycetia bacterium]|nr:Uma2 family endonuclease [Planctomycetia bacterium]